MTSKSANCVSVIVPCHNYGTFLPESLASIQHQSFNDWECIIIDDGSEDNTREVSKMFALSDERFRYIHQENNGLSHARNTGIRNSIGKYIQFLDADDLIESGKLFAQVGFLESNPHVDLVYGNAKYFDSERPGKFFSSLENDNDWMSKVSGSGNSLLSCLVNGNIMVVSSPLVTRRLVQENGFFNEKLRSHEDWEYWLRCAFNGAHFHYSETEGSRTLIRVHDKNMSHNKLDMLLSNLEIRNEIVSNLNERSLKILNCEKMLSASYNASKQISKRDKAKAVSFFIKNLPYKQNFLVLLLSLIKLFPKLIKSG